MAATNSGQMKPRRKGEGLVDARPARTIDAFEEVGTPALLRNGTLHNVCALDHHELLPPCLLLLFKLTLLFAFYLTRFSPFYLHA